MSFLSRIISTQIAMCSQKKRGKWSEILMKFARVVAVAAAVVVWKEIVVRCRIGRTLFRAFCARNVPKSLRSGGSYELLGFGSGSVPRPSCTYIIIYPQCSMVLVYLPTKLGGLWGKCWDTTRQHAKTTVDMPKGLSPSTCQNKIVSVHMQKRLSPSTCQTRWSDMQKRLPPSTCKKMFPSTCQRRLSPLTCQKGCPRRYAKTRLSPSTCKKDCLRRHAKQDCRRRHAKKIVPVDMQKNNSPSTCQRRLSPSICQQSGRRYAKTMVSADMPKSVANIPGVASVDMPRGFVRQCAKGSCPSTCQTTSYNGRIIRHQVREPSLSLRIGVVSFKEVNFKDVFFCRK